MNIECTACGSTLNVPATAIGKRGRCPKCKAVMFLAEPPMQTELLDTEEGPDSDLLSAVEKGPRAAMSPTWMPYPATPVQLDPTTQSVMYMLRILLVIIFLVIGIYFAVILVGLFFGLTGVGR